MKKHDRRLKRLLCTPSTFAFVIFLCSHALSAQDTTPYREELTARMRFPGTVLQIHSPYAVVEFVPHLTLGSAVQALGLRVTTDIMFPDTHILENIYLLFQTEYFYSFNNLGFPGDVHTGFLSGLVGMSFGQIGSLRNNFAPVGKRRQNVLFQYEYFIDSRNTSQGVATIAYYYTQPTWLIGIRAENDAFAFSGRDRFRTSAVEMIALFNTNDQIWGLGIGNIIWGGETGGIYVDLQGYHRGETINISNNYGGNYSHGILYIAGYYDSFKFSLGVDADEIREFLQNVTHFFLNAPAIAPHPHITPRIYLQFAINPRYSLF